VSHALKSSRLASLLPSTTMRVTRRGSGASREPFMPKASVPLAKCMLHK